MKIHNRKALIVLFSITYMVSYLTRINYGAIISEMGIATGFSKQALSMALTGSFITYGVGQILSGILGDKFSPKKLVLIGLGITVSMNLILPFCSSIWLMTAVWSVNGLAQAFMWPPIVRLLVFFFHKERYNNAVVRVSWGSSFGTIIVYLLSPVIILIAGWKGVFFFGAFCGTVMMVLWQSFCPNIKPVRKNNPQKLANHSKKVFTPVFFVMATAIIICGMLRDGVATWTPSLISESFNLSSGSGILSGAVLPIFGMLCYELALALYRKKFKNPLICGGMIYLLGVFSSLVLSMSLNKNAVISVISIALLNGAMHGANLMFTGMLPSFYAGMGKVSTVSGVLNSFVYIGSAISTYGIALLTESFGWGVTVLVWLVLAILGTLVCLCIARVWKKEVSAI